MQSCTESHVSLTDLNNGERFTFHYKSAELKQQVDDICKIRFKERAAKFIDVFQILGIECTEDFAIVQSAFSNKLKDCDPKLNSSDAIKLAAYRELVNAWSKVDDQEKLKYYYRHTKYIKEATARNDGKVAVFIVLDINNDQENCEPYEVFLSKMTIDMRNNFESTIDPNYYAMVVQNLSAEVVNFVGLNYEEVEEIVNREDPRKFPALIVELSVPLERLAPLEAEWGYGMTIVSKGKLYFTLRRKSEIKEEDILSITMMAVYEKTKKLQIQPNTHWPCNFDTWYPPFIDKVKTCFIWESGSKRLLNKDGKLLTFTQSDNTIIKANIPVPLSTPVPRSKQRNNFKYSINSDLESLTLISIINLYCTYKRIKHNSRTAFNQYLRSKVVGTSKEDTNYFTLSGVMEILDLIRQEAMKGHPKYSGTYLGPVDPQDNTVSHEQSISHSVINEMQGNSKPEQFAKKIFIQMVKQDYVLVFPEISTLKIDQIIKTFNNNIIFARSHDAKLRVILTFTKNFARLSPFPDKNPNLFIDQLLSFLLKKYLKISCQFSTKPFFIFTGLEESLKELKISLTETDKTVSAIPMSSDVGAKPLETISILRREKAKLLCYPSTNQLDTDSQSATQSNLVATRIEENKKTRTNCMVASIPSNAPLLSNFFTTSQERTFSSTKNDGNSNEHKNSLNRTKF